MAAGDINLAWAAAVEVAWPSDEQEGLADDTLTSAHSDTFAIDGVTEGVVDILVGITYQTETTVTASVNPVIFIYAVSPGIGGADFPPVARENMQLVGRPVPVTTAANGTQEYSNQFSLAAAFGGILPTDVKFGLFNATGEQLSTVANEVQLFVQAVYAQQEQ